LQVKDTSQEANSLDYMIAYILLDLLVCGLLSEPDACKTHKQHAQTCTADSGAFILRACFVGLFTNQENVSSLLTPYIISCPLNRAIVGHILFFNFEVDG
jgi:hypothetical protein